MKKVVKPEGIATAISLSRAVKKDRTALIIEGEKDTRIYSNWIDRNRCELYPVFGKDNVLKVIAILRDRRVAGVLAIVDADTDYLRDVVSRNPNIITTDVRDLEGMLLKSGALEKVLNEHGITHTHDNVAIREVILSATRFLGYLRLAVAVKGWHLTLDTIRHAAIIVSPQFKCDELGACKHILSLDDNKGFGRTPEELVAVAQAEMSTAHDPWHVSQGHDMASVLALIIKFYKGRAISKDEVESDLRLAFEEGHFRATALFVSICHWQERNRPFVVLRIACNQMAT